MMKKEKPVVGSGWSVPLEIRPSLPRLGLARETLSCALENRESASRVLPSVRRSRRSVKCREIHSSRGHVTSRPSDRRIEQNAPPPSAASKL